MGGLPNTQYLTYGKEIGESGTPHLQGLIHFKSAKTLRQVRAAFPTEKKPHLEPRNGTIDQAVDYCHKDGDITEMGTKPMSQAEKLFEFDFNTAELDQLLTQSESSEPDIMPAFAPEYSVPP